MHVYRYKSAPDTDPEVANVPNYRRRIKQFKNMCKKFTTFLFSRVGLCIVVIGYVALGGAIFKAIEGTHELNQRALNHSLIYDVDSSTEEMVTEIWNMTKYELIFHEKNYTNKLKIRLIDYQKKLSNAVKHGYKGNSNPNNNKWTLIGSTLYAITVVSTIGYGHITCVTDAGKIVTIFYALIGIPMILLCLANIGSSMATFFRFMYAKVCCGYCNYVKRRNLRMKNATQANVVSYAALATTNLIMNSNTQNINDKIQFLSSYPNVIAKNADLRQERDSKSPNKNSPTFEKHDFLKSLQQDKELHHNKTNQEILVQDLFEDSYSNDYKKITVPISITLFILSTYIILGGVIFHSIEQWSVLDGVYFCFITLSTIGLGDFVPGNSIDDTDNEAEYKLIGVAVYLVMGLSLVAMCFNLMQEEVTAKFRKLAVRLGIIHDPNYW